MGSPSLQNNYVPGTELEVAQELHGLVDALDR
jgi:hypothetical protein